MTPALFPVFPAHDGQSLTPHDLWTAWRWEPLVVLGLAISGLLYLSGVRALWRSAGAGYDSRTWERGRSAWVG